MKTIELEDSNFAVWCDQCDDWVSNFIPSGVEILCAEAGCGNRLLIKLPEKNKKEVRMRLARAMWGL